MATETNQISHLFYGLWVQHAWVNILNIEESLSSQVTKDSAFSAAIRLSLKSRRCLRSTENTLHLNTSVSSKWFYFKYTNRQSNSPISFVCVRICICTHTELGTTRLHVYLFHHKLKVRIAHFKLKKKKKNWTLPTLQMTSDPGIKLACL